MAACAAITEPPRRSRPVALARLLAGLLIPALLPVIPTWRAAGRSIPVEMPVDPPQRPAGSGEAAERTPSPPMVDPSRIHALDADRARALNGAVPFARRANPPAGPFHFSGGAQDLARAIDCLAAAQYYEAGDDAAGQRAVAQVVLNRVRHPAFPDTICGVVFQGQERRTGCQFTFTCDGALARTPPPVAWTRARIIATAAIEGAVAPQVGLSTHYHTDWVVPYWSASLDKTTKVGTHIFLRWTGWWGTASAFSRGGGGAEPTVARIARLSLAHRDEPALVDVVMAKAPEDGPLPMEQVAATPAAGKSWTPAPAMALPVAVRRSDPVETAADRERPDRSLIALGPHGR